MSKLWKDDYDDISAIIQYLKLKRKIDFSGYKKSISQEIIQTRIQETKCEDNFSYLMYLEKYPLEIDTLLNSLAVNYSTFFRDRISFAILEENILPYIVDDKIKSQEKDLKIWSAGCATGEEPYSIAMLLDELTERLPHSISPHITATDIDEDSLKVGRTGIYSLEKVQQIRYSLLKKYTTPCGDSFGVTSKIKNMISFFNENILEREKGELSQLFDLIICKNVMIYMTRETRRRVWNVINNSLKPGGFVILGIADFPEKETKKDLREIRASSNIYIKTRL